MLKQCTDSPELTAKRPCLRNTSLVSRYSPMHNRNIKQDNFGCVSFDFSKQNVFNDVHIPASSSDTSGYKSAPLLETFLIRFILR